MVLSSNKLWLTGDIIGLSSQRCLAGNVEVSNWDFVELHGELSIAIFGRALNTPGNLTESMISNNFPLVDQKKGDSGRYRDFYWRPRPLKFCKSKNMIWLCLNIYNWSVVWNMNFLTFHHIGNNHPNWLSYFSEGLKPPTRQCFTQNHEACCLNLPSGNLTVCYWKWP